MRTSPGPWSAVAGASLVVIAWTAGAVAEDFAQSGGAQTQAAESGGDYRMPRGDFAVGRAGTRMRLEAPRRSPTPDAELTRLKALTDEAPAAATADLQPELARSALLKECVTNTGTGAFPSDIHGAAGPTNLVVVTNVDIGVYDKSTCAIVSRVPLKTLFEGLIVDPRFETLFDPRVLYDRLSNRCLVTAESRDSDFTDQYLYVAASKDSSCTSWRRVRFVLSRESPRALFCKTTEADFYDYPSAGYNVRRLVVTANIFPLGKGAYGSVLSIDKAALYGTGPVAARCFSATLPSNLAPAVVGDRNTSMFVLSTGSGAGNSIRRLRLDTAASGPAGDALVPTPNIVIPAWSAPPNASQPNGQRLDTLDGRFQSASKQIGAFLWNVHAVNVGGFSRWRLYKLPTTGTKVLFSRTPTTSGCANADHLFNPSIDTNSASTSALAFVTATRTCPSQPAAGRAAHLIFRGPNSSDQGWAVTNVQTSAKQFAADIFGTPCNEIDRRFSCRWGDYSSTQIDPSNTSRAWGFNQLITGSLPSDWETRGALLGP